MIEGSGVGRRIEIRVRSEKAIEDWSRKDWYVANHQFGLRNKSRHNGLFLGFVQKN